MGRVVGAAGVLPGDERNFTFELAILKDHALVPTGPYAWVRHPSYAGALLSAIGVTTAQLCPGY